jgi:hypothetical protein
MMSANASQPDQEANESSTAELIEKLLKELKRLETCRRKVADLVRKIAEKEGLDPRFAALFTL